MLKQAAKLMAVNTNYATMISAPQYNRNKLKFIQISKVDESHLLATIVIEGNVIKNKIISVDEVLDDATMLKLNILMNTRLNALANISTGIVGTRAWKRAARSMSGYILIRPLKRSLEKSFLYLSRKTVPYRT